MDKHPSDNTKIKLTPEFKSFNIDDSGLQEAQKFLLRCMRYIPKNRDNVFTYIKLVNFMKEAKQDEYYYRGGAFLRDCNIERYWGYSKSKRHKARIENFSNYYEFF